MAASVTSTDASRLLAALAPQQGMTHSVSSHFPLPGERAEEAQCLRQAGASCPSTKERGQTRRSPGSCVRYGPWRSFAASQLMKTSSVMATPASKPSAVMTRRSREKSAVVQRDACAPFGFVEIGVDIGMVMPCKKELRQQLPELRRDTGSTPVVGSSSRSNSGS